MTRLLLLCLLFITQLNASDFLYSIDLIEGVLLESEISPTKDGVVFKPEYDESGKIKTLHRSLDFGQSYLPLLNLTYDGQTTDVDYLQGKRVLYSFDTQKQIRSITTFTHDNLYKVETYEWKEGHLTKKTVKDPLGVSLIEELYSYDSQGNLIIETLKGCLTKEGTQNETYTIIHSYNSQNQKIKTEEQNGKITQFYYDAQGHLIQRTTTLNRELIDEVCFIYDQEGRLTQEWDLTAQEFKKYNYDDQKAILGRMNLKTKQEIIKQPEEINTGEINKVYGLLDELVLEEQFRDGQLINKKSYSYDQRGNLIAITDLGGNLTTYEYDPLGRKCFERSPEVLNGDEQLTAFTWHYAYDPLNRLNSVINPSGYETRTIYNTRGLPLSIYYPDHTEKHYEYALDGSMQKEIYPDGTFSTYDYDGVGRLLKKSDYSALGIAIDEVAYIYSGRKLKQEVHQKGLTIYHEYDDWGRIAQQTAPQVEKKVQYVYDASGGLDHQKEWYGVNDFVEKCATPPTTMDENPCTITWRLNDAGQMVREVITPLANGLIQSDLYDPLQRIEQTTLTTLDHKVVLKKKFRYDANNCKIKEIINDTMTIKWVYTPTGKLAQLIEGEQATSYYYNDKGQLAEIVKPDGVSLNHVYNDAGRLIQLTDSAQTVHYLLHYDDKGQLIQYEDLIATRSGAREFDLSGQLKSETLANGLTLQYTYDLLGRRTQIKLPDLSQIIYKFSKNIDEIQRLDPLGKVLYTHKYLESHAELIYDLGAVHYGTTEISTPYFSQKATLDDQNRIITLDTKDPLGSVEEHFQYNDLSELTSKQSDCDLKYDLNGNLIEKKSSSHTFHFTYDALNRLCEVYQDTQLVHQYRYDPFHRRIQDDVEGKKFLYDGLWEMGACDIENQITELRVFEPAASSDHGKCIAIELQNDIFAPIYDLMGSLVMLISREGQIREWHRYTAFGLSQSFGNAISPWGFRNKRQDSTTGTIHFGRRDYDPETQEWTSKDPLIFADGHNRYAFLHNNPLNHQELFGLKSFSQLWDEFKTWGWDLLKKIGAFFLSPWSITQSIEYTIGKGNILLLGFVHTKTLSGVYGKGEVNDKVRVSFINGILNDDVDMMQTLQSLSKAHGNVNIHFIKRSTHGWVADLLNAIAIKCGFKSKEAYLLAASWKHMIQEMGGPHGGGTIIHYAHSLGTIDTMEALAMLSPEEQKMIEVYGFGPPSLTPNTTQAYVRLFISARDGIALLDPIRFMKSLLADAKAISIIGPFDGMPFIDHLFCSQTYQDLWKSMGKTFVEWYGTI